ncbi:MAG: ribosome recycling factor [Elusimicrobia bacterium]|nr:ribosome recycling factor [Elusimicrobiota bacterium]
METEINLQQLIVKTEETMKNRIEKLRSDFGTLRTGRANPQLVDGIRVEYYGSLTPLKQVAAISVGDARSIEIRPWDPSSLEAIEKALQKSDLGITPTNDGKMIRLNFPTMTEDRRKDLLKVVRKMAEDFKVTLRNDRRETLEKLKKVEKNKEISEDERIRQENIIQKLTDTYIKKVDEILSAKEKEILTI